MTDSYQSLLAIDVGSSRIGVARAHLQTLFARPLKTLGKPESFVQDILETCQSEQAAIMVIGLPRGLSGQDTAQTDAVRQFGGMLEQQLQIPVYWMDEAVTSEQAESELRSSGKPYNKGDIDALAATYILEDFISGHKKDILEIING